MSLLSIIGGLGKVGGQSNQDNAWIVRGNVEKCAARWVYEKVTNFGSSNVWLIKLDEFVFVLMVKYSMTRTVKLCSYLTS